MTKPCKTVAGTEPLKSMLLDRMAGWYKSVIYHKNYFGLELLPSSPITSGQKIKYLNCTVVLVACQIRTQNLPEVTEWVTLIVLLTDIFFS